MSKRILVLLLAAIVIAGLTAYKQTRTYNRPLAIAGRVVKRRAPLLELYDAHKPSRRVRLSAYLGRHRLIIVFFDGELGADRDPRLLRLRQEVKRIDRAGIVVLAISAALPQQNRKVIARVEKGGGRILFPLLSDPAFEVHRAWKRFNETTGKPTQGIFLVDRAGLLEWSSDGPQPIVLSDPKFVEFIQGR